MDLNVQSMNFSEKSFIVHKYLGTALNSMAMFSLEGSEYYNKNAAKKTLDSNVDFAKLPAKERKIVAGNMQQIGGELVQTQANIASYIDYIDTSLNEMGFNAALKGSQKSKFLDPANMDLKLSLDIVNLIKTSNEYEDALVTELDILLFPQNDMARSLGELEILNDLEGVKKEKPTNNSGMVSVGEIKYIVDEIVKVRAEKNSISKKLRQAASRQKVMGFSAPPSSVPHIERAELEQLKNDLAALYTNELVLINKIIKKASAPVSRKKQ